MGRRKKEEIEEEEGDGQGFTSINFDLSTGAKRTITSMVLLLLAIIFFLGLINMAGPAGEKMTGAVGLVFGLGKFIFPFLLVFISFILLRTKMPTGRTATKIIGTAVMFVCILSLLHLLPHDATEYKAVAQAGKGGGYIGYGIATLIVSQLGKVASSIALFIVMIIAAIFAFNKSLVGLGDKVPQVKKPDMNIGMNLFGRKKKDDDEDEDDEYEEDEFEEDDTQDQEDDVEEVVDDELDMEGFDDDTVADIEPVQPLEEPETAAQKASKIMGAKGSAPKKSERKEKFESEEWQLPPLRLLSRGGGKAKGGDVNQRAQVIQDTFANFGINMELEDIITGPTVTQFSFRPPSGVKLTKIVALSADLALALAAHPIRIEAPIPGKSLVGIEVPNKETAMVRLRDIINTEKFENPEKSLLLALGEDVNGDYVIEDLGKMPHLLVAGATGAGKSVAVNSILLSLLYKNSPDDLKMILVDPKRVELSLYNGIPHLLSDVITDSNKVLNALKWAASEMERRYKILQKVGTRDLDSYNVKRKAGETMMEIDEETGVGQEVSMENLPVIIIVIDEMADLMGTHGKEVEGVIVRLAQMSRAVGIHLILSTQRPSVEVITGTIKANLPTRIALRVATNIDSRTIIDMPGAEKLVGHGDMLFVGPASPSPHRCQGVYVAEEEVKKVIDYIKRQAKATGAYDIEEDFSGDDDSRGAGTEAGIKAVDFDNVAATASGIGAGNADQDPMFEEAKKVVIEAGKASTSYIQRRLRVGYSRAARLVDELEDQGIIGPAEGSKPRKILSGAEAGDAPAYDEPMEDQAKRDEWK